MSCAGIAFAVYAVLALIGAPIWLLVRPLSPPLSDALACPLLGFAVFDLFSWYWLRYTNTGLVHGLPVLGMVVAVALVWVVLRRRDIFRKPSLASCASTAGLIAAVTIAFVGEFRVPLRLGYLTSASIWNADIAQYAGVAAGLVSHGFGWSGNIAGVDLGHWATDAPWNRAGCLRRARGQSRRARASVLGKSGSRCSSSAWSSVRSRYATLRASSCPRASWPRP